MFIFPLVIVSFSCLVVLFLLWLLDTAILAGVKLGVLFFEIQPSDGDYRILDLHEWNMLCNEREVIFGIDDQISFLKETLAAQGIGENGYLGFGFQHLSFDNQKKQSRLRALKRMERTGGGSECAFSFEAIQVGDCVYFDGTAKFVSSIDFTLSGNFVRFDDGSRTQFRPGERRFIQLLPYRRR